MPVNNFKNKRIYKTKTSGFHLSPFPSINREIFQYFKLFTSNKLLLKTALIQNPFKKTANLHRLKESLDQNIIKNLKILNRLHDQDQEMITSSHLYHDHIILFLINYTILAKKKISKEIYRKIFSPTKANYALKLLEKVDATDIRVELEDVFFSLLEPGIYQNYKSLLNLTKKGYKKKQQEITKDFKQILLKSQIKAQIQSRVKTIYSIHQKITKKNILLSQVLDTIGIRIIAGTEDECYKLMVLILKDTPVITSRVKDYIAIPKDNGYQSIHLTIYHKEHPVEIQIRTKQMHTYAQYGKAAHTKYKAI